MPAEWRECGGCAPPNMVGVSGRGHSKLGTPTKIRDRKGNAMRIRGPARLMVLMLLAATTAMITSGVARSGQEGAIREMEYAQLKNVPGYRAIGIAEGESIGAFALGAGHVLFVGKDTSEIDPHGRRLHFTVIDVRSGGSWGFSVYGAAELWRVAIVSPGREVVATYIDGDAEGAVVIDLVKSSFLNIPPSKSHVLSDGSGDFYALSGRYGDFIENRPSLGGVGATGDGSRSQFFDNLGNALSPQSLRHLKDSDELIYVDESVLVFRDASEPGGSVVFAVDRRSLGEVWRRDLGEHVEYDGTFMKDDGTRVLQFQLIRAGEVRYLNPESGEDAGLKLPHRLQPYTPLGENCYVNLSYRREDDSRTRPRTPYLTIFDGGGREVGSMKLPRLCGYEHIEAFGDVLCIQGLRGGDGGRVTRITRWETLLGSETPVSVDLAGNWTVIGGEAGPDPLLVGAGGGVSARVGFISVRSVLRIGKTTATSPPPPRPSPAESP